MARLTLHLILWFSRKKKENWIRKFLYSVPDADGRSKVVGTVKIKKKHVDGGLVGLKVAASRQIRRRVANHLSHLAVHVRRSCSFSILLFCSSAKEEYWYFGDSRVVPLFFYFFIIFSTIFLWRRFRKISSSFMDVLLDDFGVIFKISKTIFSEIRCPSSPNGFEINLEWLMKQEVIHPIIKLIEIWYFAEGFSPRSSSLNRC